MTTVNLHDPPRRPCGLAHAVFCLGILVVFAERLPALDPARHITQYAHASWKRQDGWLPGAVFSLAQTRDGALWIGTEAGLLRFDGVRFASCQGPSCQDLSSQPIARLLAARDGSLWIGTRDALLHRTGARIEKYPTASGDARPSVSALAEDRSGAIWAGTAGYKAGALCTLDGARLRCDGYPGLPQQAITALLEDRSGNLWAGGAGLWRLRPGPVQTYVPHTPGAAILAIKQNSQREIVATTPAEGGLLRLTGGALAPYPLPRQFAKVRPMALLSDRNGGLWIGTLGDGLLHLYGDRVDQFTQADGLSSDSVHALFEDHEGNVWAGTEEGLDRFREFAVATITKRDGLSNNVITGLYPAREGSVWVGTIRGLDRVQGNRPGPGRLPGLQGAVTGIFEDQAGRLWASTPAGLQISTGAAFEPVRDPVARRIRGLVAAAEDRDHNVWFSDPDVGLVRVNEQRVAEVVSWSRDHDARVFALDINRKNGALWLGLSQGGVACFRPGRAAKLYVLDQGVSGGAVRDLRFARDGTLWIAGDSGLSRIRDGQAATVTRPGGLPCDKLFALVEDDTGGLWINSACGIIHIESRDLRAWSDHPAGKLIARLFDATDGVHARPATSGYFAHSGKSRDGRLWFAMLDGVAMIDPAHLPHNDVAPAMQIDQMLANRKPYSAGEFVRLPAGTQDLQIDYTAFSFVAPERVRFRYRLEGYDQDWIDAGGRRTALYTSLDPKSYRFRVIAANNDGVWNQEGAAYEFSIQPAFYQTLWFEACLVLTSLLFLGFLYKLRMQYVSHRLQVLWQERLAERTRIARELHDDLLQNLAGLGLQLDGLSKIVKAPPQASEQLVNLRIEAEHWLRDVRESVWDLRSPDWEVQDLATALQQTGDQFTRGHNVRFHLEMDARPPALERDLQRQVLRIVREALRNVIRHAAAADVWIQMRRVPPHGLELEVRDNGHGFDPAQVSVTAGHWGLSGMRERAAQIGVQLSITSKPSQGTSIKMVLPLVDPSS